MSVQAGILATLKENQGYWVSGQTLSESLNVSRTAIWKHIKNLLEEGYEIESASKKGYRLSGPANVLTQAEVGSGLTTQLFGRESYFYFREIDSTNNRAKALAAEGAPEGTVVVADMQTAGRGRRGRQWFSPFNQGIYVSVVLRPSLPLREISRISLVAAVAVAETLREEFGLDALIKWPNDILIDHKKIAGILSEAVIDTVGLEYMVVGIGLNINQDLSQFPADLRMPATSLRVEKNQAVARVKILQSLLLSLEHHYLRLLAGDFESILIRARALSMVLGQQVRLETAEGFVIGKAVDINSDGYLMVVNPDGSVQAVMSGEIDVV